MSGAYVWHFTPPDQLVGAEADGWMEDRIRHVRLTTAESPLVNEAIHKKRAVYNNALPSEFESKSAMAIPLLAFNEVVGAAVFLHTAEPNFFNSDHVAKATILGA
ncbi:MAG TPA: GAF domain-containing protein, partial [Terriglobales bacterium]